MRMGTQVHRHQIDANVEVCAVTEIKTAQKVLVGLAVATVLRDDKARHDLKQLTQRKELADPLNRMRRYVLQMRN